MIDADTLRASIEGWLTNTGARADLDDLTDLGAVHYAVLMMLSERIQRLHAAGYSKADLHTALSDEVVLAHELLADPPSEVCLPGRQTGTGA